MRAFATLFGLLASLVLATPARAVLEVDITGGLVEPLPVAVSPFAGDSPEAADYGERLAEVVAADLERSGLFRPIDRRAFIQSPDELRAGVRYADWRQINAQALIAGTVTQAGGAELVVEFRLFDVFAGQQLSGLRLTTAPDQWRRVAHKIADEVYARITGESGYFDTQIVYVAESGPKERRVTRLALMDVDGANHRFLTDGSELVLSPSFAPDAREVAYMAYRDLTPDIFVHDLSSGRDRRLIEFDALAFAPSFSPNGRRVALTVAQDGNSDVYTVDRFGGGPTRVTADAAIDTSPSFAPQGTRLVFNSDRGGSPQLYTADADGANVRRISFGAGRYGSPAWSPRGDLIAFVNIKDGMFHIGVMKPDGSDERLLTRAWREESPTFSPNGRVILFSRTPAPGAAPRLFSVDITGYNEREVPTPLAATDPDWSPLIP